MPCRAELGRNVASGGCSLRACSCSASRKRCDGGDLPGIRKNRKVEEAEQAEASSLEYESRAVAGS